MSYQRIAVIGAHGQIGSALVTALKSRALALSRQSLELTQTPIIIPTLDSLAPDAIINAAAYTQVERAQDDALLAMRINADAPEQMAIYAANAHIPFIHVSTDYVFDGKKTSPYVEDDATAPINVYGRSKLAGEQAVLTVNPDAIIVRTSWVNHSHGQNFIRTIAEKARTEKQLKIVADQWGAPSFACDIANGIITVLSHMKKQQARGIFHLTNAGYTSWHGLTCALVEQMRKHETLRVESVEAITSDAYITRAERPLNSRLDCSKIQQVFDIALRPWQDALQETLAGWYARS